MAKKQKTKNNSTPEDISDKSNDILDDVEETQEMS